MEPSDDEVIALGEDETRVNLVSDAVLLLPFECSPETDVSLRFARIPRAFAPHQEELPVPKDVSNNKAIHLSRFFDFGYLERQFEDRIGFRFQFVIIAWEPVDLNAFRDEGWIEESVEESEAHRRIRIVSHLSPRNPENVNLLLRHYPKTIGNLDEEIIWEIQMFDGRGPASWQTEIDGIDQPFTLQSFRSMIAQALHAQSQPVSRRIPAFLRRVHPESSSETLEVAVTIPEIRPEEAYTIRVVLRDVARELYYPTNVPALDQCIRDVHLQLLENGIPVGPKSDMYQRVLSHLLIYRHACASTVGYIDASVAEQPEIEGFHRHLLGRLAHQLDIVPVAVVSEPEIGNSRVDLLIEGIPTELKLEDRKRATTDDTVKRQ